MNAAVVKVGGSLAAHPAKLKELCVKLGELSKKYKLVVVGGGGEFADVARNYDKLFSLSPQTSHRMAILGMDQHGLLLADLTPNSVSVTTLLEAKKVLDSGNLPVFLPSKLMLSEDPLENSWDVTSDSIAAYIAHRLQAQKLLLVTDVDGVYSSDPKNDSEAKLLGNLSAKDLLAMSVRTSVDASLPKLLLKWKLSCYVVSGLFPERVEAVLNEQRTVCSVIC